MLRSSRSPFTRLAAASIAATVVAGSLAGVGLAQDDESPLSSTDELTWRRVVEPGLATYGRPVGLATDGSTVIAVAVGPAGSGRAARVRTTVDGGKTWPQTAVMSVGKGAEIDVGHDQGGFTVVGRPEVLVSVDGRGWTALDASTPADDERRSTATGEVGSAVLPRVVGTLEAMTTALDTVAALASASALEGADITDWVRTGDGTVYVLGSVGEFGGKRLPALWLGARAGGEASPTIAEAGAAYERLATAFNRKQAKLLQATLPSPSAARRWAKRMARTYADLIDEIESYDWPAQASAPMADFVGFMERSQGDFRDLAALANDTKRWNRQIKRMARDDEWNATVAIAVRDSLDLPLSQALRKLKRELDR